MFEPDKFHVTETLHDGSTVEIRAQKPEDREEISRKCSMQAQRRFTTAFLR